MHRILTQNVDITTARDADMQQIQQHLAAAWSSARGDAIERLFDDVCGPDQVIRIDRLELDLGDIAGPDWLDTFFSRLTDAAARELETPVRTTTPMNQAAENQDGLLCLATGIQHSTPGQSRADAVLAYLRQGRLPWWTDIHPGPGWLTATLLALSPTAQRATTKAARQNGKIMQRLVFALPARVMAELASADLPDVTAEILTTLARALAPGAATTASWCRVLPFWRSVLSADAGRDAGLIRTEISAVWAGLMTSETPETTGPRKPPPLPRPLPAPWSKSIRHAILQAIADPTRLRPDDESAQATPSDLRSGDTDRPAWAASSPEQRAADDMPAATDPTVGPPDKVTPKDATPATADIPVIAAGLVILHPFLPELFSQCGYLKDGRFAEPLDQHRAVRLLGYLALGVADMDEAGLTLAKVLAGMDLDEVLIPKFPALETQAAADRLLNAVVGHWTALGDCSANWLREVFLNRNGILKPTEQGWTLHVETQAQDVLLGRLPWGYGAITAPWMPAPLSVRWID